MFTRCRITAQQSSSLFLSHCSPPSLAHSHLFASACERLFPSSEFAPLRKYSIVSISSSSSTFPHESQLLFLSAALYILAGRNNNCRVKSGPGGCLFRGPLSLTPDKSTRRRSIIGFCESATCASGCLTLRFLSLSLCFPLRLLSRDCYAFSCSLFLCRLFSLSLSLSGGWSVFCASDDSFCV